MTHYFDPHPGLAAWPEGHAQFESAAAGDSDVPAFEKFIAAEFARPHDDVAASHRVHLDI